MRVRYEVDLEDLMDFNEYFAMHSPNARKKALRHRRFVTLCLLLVPPALVYLMHIYVLVPAVFLASICLSAHFCQTCPERANRQRKKILHRMHSEGRLETILGERELELSDTGLISRVQGVETKVEWAAFEKIDTAPNYTYLFISPLTIVIPHNKIVEGNWPAMLAEIGRRYHPDQTLPRIDA